jgi:hypothetical protein
VTKEISTMTRTLALLLAVTIAGLSACASGSPEPQSSVAAPPGPPVGEMRRLAVVPSGESKFTTAGTTRQVGRIFEQIAKWYPPAAWLAPLAMVVERGINWLAEEGRKAATASHLRGIAPGTVVADAFARTLVASGRFDQVRMLPGEPVDEDRRSLDALVRVMVPAWGILRVREGEPDLMAAYADTRAQVVVRPTGVIVWEHDEDVTQAERLPLRTFTGDGDLTRQALSEVLERAGQRLANEFLYARSAAR